jgi:hypothetical protein
MRLQCFLTLNSPVWRNCSSLFCSPLLMRQGVVSNMYGILMIEWHFFGDVAGVIVPWWSSLVAVLLNGYIYRDIVLVPTRYRLERCIPYRICLWRGPAFPR